MNRFKLIARRMLGAGVAMLAAASVAKADEAMTINTSVADHYWYTGGDIRFNMSSFSSGSIGVKNADANSVGLTLRGGYQFSPYFSLESTLASLGRPKYNKGRASDGVRGSAWTLDGVGYLPVTDSVSLFGVLGVGIVVGERTGSIRAEDQTRVGPHFGAGVAYDLSKTWRLRAQYDNYPVLSWNGPRAASFKTQSVSVGFDYRFR